MVMKGRILVASLVCILLTMLGGGSYAQDVPPIIELYDDLQVPIDILIGVIGKYSAMIEQHQAMIAQGEEPETVVGFRLAAKVVMPDGDGDADLDSALQGMSEMAFWVETNIFARHSLYFSTSMSGNMGDIEILSTPEAGYIISRDEAVFSYLDTGQDMQQAYALFPIFDSIPGDFISEDPDFFMSLEQLPELLTAYVLDRLPILDIGYDGQELTSGGIAHVVRLAFTDTGEIVVLWILDETWDIHKVEYHDPATGASTVAVIRDVEFVTSDLPDAAFAADLSGLAEISYEDFLALLGLNVSAVGLTGAPVVADLSVSLPSVQQGEEIVVRSNGMDAEDEESALVPEMTLIAPDGSNIMLTTSYVNGQWEATFVPSLSGMPGMYSAVISYTDTAGTISDPLEVADVFNVIGVQPQVLSISPEPQATDVLVSSQISVTFDLEMNEESVKSAFSVIDDMGNIAQGMAELVDGKLVFSSEQGLAYGHTYTAKLLGNVAALNTMALGEDLVWTFTTEFAPLPKIADIIPGDMQKNVSISSQVDVVFTELMDQASAESAFSLKVGDQDVSGLFLWDGSTMSFVPEQSLEYNTTYEVRIAGSASSSLGAGLDGDGDGIAGGTPADDVSQQFNTEIFPVFAIDPASQSVLAGELVTIDIVAESMNNLLGFSLTISFDPEVLRLLKLERRSFAEWRPRPKHISNVDEWLKTTIDDEKGIVVLAVDSTRSGGVRGTGVIASLMFQTKGVGDSSIQLGDAAATNASGESMAFGLRDGNVQSMAFYPQDVNHDGIVDIRDLVTIQNNRGADPDVNGDGIVDIQDMVAVAGAQASPALLPTVSKLCNNFPNPFNPETWIPYQLAESSHVTIRVYSAAGHLVRTLDLGYRSAGQYSTKSAAAYWDGANEAGERVASGIYYYSISAGDFSAVKKMIISK